MHCSWTMVFTEHAAEWLPWIRITFILKVSFGPQTFIFCYLFSEENLNAVSPPYYCRPTYVFRLQEMKILETISSKVSFAQQLVLKSFGSTVFNTSFLFLCPVQLFKVGSIFLCPYVQLCSVWAFCSCVLRCNCVQLQLPVLWCNCPLLATYS